MTHKICSLVNLMKGIECMAIVDGDFFPEDPTKKDFVNRVPCLLG